eukprot:GFUD01039308.1.p1 GENE.GFUD01039308.1~~GFUD01039308.1.p1  ORF type:complete len:712 (+),score=283.13 GFUD01039308.1:109-2136(+)
MDKNKEKELVALTAVKESQLVSLEYNPKEHAVIVNSCVKGNNHSYQLFFIIEGAANMKPKIKKSPGRSAVWAAHNRFALLDTSCQLLVKNLDNQNVNFAGFTTGFLLPKSEAQVTNKVPACEELFAGGQAGCVLMKDGDLIIKYDILKRRRQSSGLFESVKHVAWFCDGTMLAMFSKHQLWLCDKNLKVLQKMKCRATIKSVCWCKDTSTLLYTTENQLLYLLPSGDSGVVSTIQEPLYLALVRESQAVCLTRQGKLKVLNINNTEYKFKSAVIRGAEPEIMSLIASGQLVGQSQLQFLRSVGRPELALSFIRDPLSIFCLAMESNDLSSALAAAKTVDTQDTWDKLANLALLNGDLAIAEVSYQKSRSFTRLMFLYLVTGQRDKLNKLARIMRVKGDLSGVYQVHLITGNRQEGAELLELGGQKQLAGLMRSQEPGQLGPPQPVGREGGNWPTKKDEPLKNLPDTEIIKENYREQLKDTFEKVPDSSSCNESSSDIPAEQSVDPSSYPVPMPDSPLPGQAVQHAGYCWVQTNQSRQCPRHGGQPGQALHPVQCGQLPPPEADPVQPIRDPTLPVLPSLHTSPPPPPASHSHSGPPARDTGDRAPDDHCWPVYQGGGAVQECPTHSHPGQPVQSDKAVCQVCGHSLHGAGEEEVWQDFPAGQDQAVPAGHLRHQV